jgi:hypothetical protein
LQPHHSLGGKRRSGSFHNGAAGAAPHRGVIHGLGGGAPARHESARHHGPLGHGIDLAVGAAQGSKYQDAALEVGGIAHRGHGDIDAEAGLCERRQGRGHHDRRSILDTNRIWSNRDSHAGENIGQALVGKDRLLTVTGSSQPYHHAVSD